MDQIYPTHHCVAGLCETQVPYDRLMCSKHWYMVPKALRNDVWREWNDGDPTDKHTRAIVAAARSVDEQLEKALPTDVA